MDEKAERCARRLKSDETWSGIFTRNMRSKSGLVRFNLYDDNEDLVMIAEASGTSEYILRVCYACGSFKKSDPFVIGTGRYRSTTGKWRMFRKVGAQEQKVLKLKLGKISDGDGLGKSFRPHVTRIDDDGREVPIVQAPFLERMTALFPRIAERHQVSNRNVFMESPGGKHAYSFAKVDEDEYHFAVSGPLNLFEGFCAASSLFFE